MSNSARGTTYRRARPWLTAGLVAGVGLVEAVVFAAQGRLASAAVAVILLGLLAWLLSPASFPRSVRHADLADGGSPSPDVVVYWRPGCAYCLRLRWSLAHRAGAARWINIWADEAAAAFVRSVNDGNETVPTVVVAGTAHTNPEVSVVRRALPRS